MWNHSEPMYPWFGNQRMEDFCNNLKSWGRIVLSKGKARVLNENAITMYKLKLGMGMLR